MSKTFKCAGVSTRNGVIKARFASDMTRVKVLAKTGSKDIDMIELKEPMVKEDAVAFLLSINFDNGNKAIREALEADLAKRQPSAKTATKVVAKKGVMKPKAAKSTPAKDAVKAKAVVAKAKVSKAEVAKQLAELEDAPY